MAAVVLLDENMAQVGEPHLGYTLQVMCWWELWGCLGEMASLGFTKQL